MYYPGKRFQSKQNKKVNINVKRIVLFVSLKSLKIHHVQFLQGTRIKVRTNVIASKTAGREFY